MNDVERNRKPLYRYRNTFRAQDGVINKDTKDGLRAWAIRNIMSTKMGPTADDELAALEDWEWDTRMRIRTVDALERIAAAMDRAHPKSWKDHTVGQMLEGVGISGESHTPDGKYTMNPSFEFNCGLYGFGGVFHDDDGKSWFALDLDPEFVAKTPEELRGYAQLFRSNYADALEWIADEWQEQLDAGEVRLLEPDDLPNDNKEEEA